MDGLKEFRQVQLGRECKNGGGAGTAVAATARWRGEGVGEDLTPVVSPAEDVNAMLDYDRTYIPYEGASFKQGPDVLTFEQFPYILAAAIRGVEKGTRDGSGSDYIYDYPFPLNLSSVEITATTISFALTGKKITDSGSGLAFVKTGDIIQVTGSTSNNGIYTVATGAVAGEIVVNETLVNESAGASVTIEVLRQTYTIEAGDNQQAYEASYCFPESFELSGKGGASGADAIMLSSTWYGRKWTKTTFTPSLSLPTVKEALFSLSKLYIDAGGGTIGTTQITATMTEFSLKVETGIRRFFGGGGNLYFTDAKRRKKPKITLELGMLYNAAAVAEVDHRDAQDARLIQLKLEGPAVAAAGSVYSKKTILINLPGKWTKFSGIEDAEPGDVIKGTFEVKLASGAADLPRFIVVSELSTLP